MPKVFISHSYQDKDFVNKLQQRLIGDGVQAFTNEKDVLEGVNVIEKITSALTKTDFFIVVLSNNSVNSSWVNFELSATKLYEIQKEQNIIIPLVIDNCEIPFSLGQRLLLDFRYTFEDSYQKLLRALNTDSTKNLKETNRQDEEFKIESYEQQIINLKSAYNSGILTLFCGAGISYDSNIPTWNTLLRSLLKAVYNENQVVPDIDVKLANLFQKRINVSPLILGQYLKTLLGKKFTSTVRDTLYKDCTDTNKTIDAIAKISKQKRNRKPLMAIITFNFDDLIEEKLTSDGTDFKTIFSEGERFKDEQIPIYHPHGFLPRKKKLDSKNEIVFSEDTYHSQFIDPYSWSNLIQLNHLNNCTCLFIGISLTDPNMRRLLDVSIRKNGKSEKNHYIIKKRYKIEDLYPEVEVVSHSDKKVIPILENIEEQDANNLGFNVIWVNDYKEIPDILLEIQK